jgi:hypothetical protein
LEANAAIALPILNACQALASSLVFVENVRPHSFVRLPEGLQTVFSPQESALALLKLNASSIRKLA